MTVVEDIRRLGLPPMMLWVSVRMVPLISNQMCVNSFRQKSGMNCTQFWKLTMAGILRVKLLWDYRLAMLIITPFRFPAKKAGGSHRTYKSFG